MSCDQWEYHVVIFVMMIKRLASWIRQLGFKFFENDRNHAEFLESTQKKENVVKKSY